MSSFSALPSLPSSLPSILTSLGPPIAAAGLATAAGWTALYFGLKAVMPPKMGRRLHNCDGTAAITAVRDASVNTGEGALRVVTIVYASGICVLAAISNLVVGPWAYSSVGEKNTPLQTLTLQLSLGYFLFDLTWSVVAGGETLLLLCHHLASLGAVLSGLFLDASGSELVGSLFGAEISQLPLQIRWFMLEAGLKGTRQMLVVDLWFALTFLICRVLWAPTLLYVVIVSDKPHWCIKVGGSALQVISWLWAFVVWGKLVKALKGVFAGRADSASASKEKDS